MVFQQPSTVDSAETSCVTSEPHITCIHVFQERSGIVHRCSCGFRMVRGMDVGSCEVCISLVSSPNIEGVLPPPLKGPVCKSAATRNC
jgi:hypothetical protein